MSALDWIAAAIPLGLALLLAWPLSGYLARVFQHETTALDRVLGPLERGLYRLAGVTPERGMSWRAYTAAMLLFQLVGLAAVFGLQRAQAGLPLNPDGLGSISWHSALNTAISFVTNTNWQGYGGETTMSYLTQSLGLTVQNFVSAATGLAIAAALARALSRHEDEDLGNFWVDLVRGTLWVLLPLSLALALVLVSQGVVQTWEPAVQTRLIDPVLSADGTAITEQLIARGPAASQIAIKQLGTNGGGFFNTNSAHPFENPTPLSNLVECVSILLIPAACCGMFGRLVGDRGHGRALLAAMTALLVLAGVATLLAEHAGNPLLHDLGLADGAGNLEGKELRFGVVGSAVWAVFTTAASNGSVNAMHDSLLPLGGLLPLALIQVGEVVFGGVGSGLYGMVVFAFVAVFLSGLMVGRTPEYLGKKLGAFEMQMCALVILAPSAATLVGTALALSVDAGRTAALNPGAHGFTEILYAYASASNNNGSAFGGIGANTPFYNISLGLCMVIGRYAVAVPVLAIAGSLARKKKLTISAGTLPTHGPLFVVLLCGVVVLVGALTFAPSLVLGPVAEHLSLWSPS